jgi:hypothetical protein
LRKIFFKGRNYTVARTKSARGRRVQKKYSMTESATHEYHMLQIHTWKRKRKLTNSMDEEKSNHIKEKIPASQGLAMDNDIDDDNESYNDDDDDRS